MREDRLLGSSRTNVVDLCIGYGACWEYKIGGALDIPAASQHRSIWV